MSCCNSGPYKDSNFVPYRLIKLISKFAWQPLPVNLVLCNTSFMAEKMKRYIHSRLEIILLSTSIPKTKKKGPDQLNEWRITQNKVYQHWLPSCVVCCQMTSYFEKQKEEESMIVYRKSCWNILHFKFSPFDASNVSTYL